MRINNLSINILMYEVYGDKRRNTNTYTSHSADNNDDDMALSVCLCQGRTIGNIQVAPSKIRFLFCSYVLLFVCIGSFVCACIFFFLFVFLEKTCRMLEVVVQAGPDRLKSDCCSPPPPNNNK